MVKLVGTLSSYRRRAVVVGGVADRYASELARAGQSNRQRAGTGSASSECATRPPLWPAGMAEGNRATFGPRVGLSSHGSPAKGGPKSKCLARLKIARTSAGPPSLTISDLSRFLLPVSLSAPCLAFCSLSRFLLPVSLSAPCLAFCSLSRFLLPVSLSAPCLAFCSLSRFLLPRFLLPPAFCSTQKILTRSDPKVSRADGDSQVSALGVDLPSGAPFACKHRLKHRNRAPGQQGLRAGANLLGRNLDGNQIARKYRTCAKHADLLFRDGGKRQAGKCNCLLEFTSRPELSLGAAHESGHNSMCQNGLKVLLRVTVRPKKRDSSAISSGVAALKSAESTPVRDCPGLLER